LQGHDIIVVGASAGGVEALSPLVRVARSRERQTEWNEKWASEEQRLYESLIGG
jgi:hypothetical protein